MAPAPIAKDKNDDDKDDGWLQRELLFDVNSYSLRLVLGENSVGVCRAGGNICWF